MKQSKKLIFFGTESFSGPTLEKLLAEDWPVLAVVTKPDSPSGRGQKISAPLVKSIAEKNGVEVFQPQKVSEINAKIAQLKPDFGVLVAYGKIIPQSTIDLFPGGIINVHPSLLPKYRGPAPVENAILNGDSRTGLSLMELSAKMDAGPVYAQNTISLSGSEDRPSLYEELSQAGAVYLMDNLEDITSGRLAPKPQNVREATYTKLLKKEDGLIDWSKPAEIYEREVRAYLGFPRSRAKIFGNEVVITKARIAHDNNDGDLVLTAAPGYLEIEELIAPSGRKMSGADFNRGYKKV